MTNDDRQNTFRVAIRRFAPFEAAIEKQWASFQAATGCPLRLEWESLDLNPLVDSLFAQCGLKDGTWDIAFIVTDWLAEAVAEGSLLDLAPFMEGNPVPDYPEGWAPSLTGMQRFGDAIYGLPYHDGPECLVYRTDLFADRVEQSAFAERSAIPSPSRAPGTSSRTWPASSPGRSMGCTAPSSPRSRTATTVSTTSVFSSGAAAAS